MECRRVEHSMDVVAAFLYGALIEGVYLNLPGGFGEGVVKLKSALYGLRQAPMAWYVRLCDYLLKGCFVVSDSYACRFGLER